jgi:hypothetical protein
VNRLSSTLERQIVRIGRLLSDHERPVGFPIVWKQVLQRELLLDLHSFGLPRVRGSLDSLKDHSLNRFLEPFVELDGHPRLPKFIVGRPSLCISGFGN